MPALTRAVAPFAVVSAVVALVLLWRTRPHATLAECATLLDRYVELLVRQEWPEQGALFVREQQERTRERARRTPSFTQCPHEVSRRELRCALAAESVDAFEKCLE